MSFRRERKRERGEGWVGVDWLEIILLNLHRSSFTGTDTEHARSSSFHPHISVSLLQDTDLDQDLNMVKCSHFG